MDCGLAFLAILLLLLAAAGSLASGRFGRSQQRRNFQRLAQRFAGQFRPGGLFRSALVVIRYGETRAIIRESAGQGPYQGRSSQVLIDFPDFQLHCDLFPRDGKLQLPPSRWLQVRETGNHEFDATFTLRASGRSDLARLLSDGVRWQLSRLLRLDGHQQLYVRLSRGQVLVQKPGPLRRFEDLERLVAVSLELYDQLMLTRAEGIEFLQEDGLQPVEQAKCTICGEEIREDMVYCERCKTPHHGDCWQYSGGCAVYGCRESRFLRPRTGTPADEARGA